MSNAEYLKEYQRKIAAGEIEKPKQKTPLEKAEEDPGSMRKAINAKCYECVYDPVGGSGSWRDQVRACGSKSCPLYSVKPK